MATHNSLFAIFTWERRETSYRVRFVDGDEYELWAVQAGQDKGEALHGSANVARTIRRADGTTWPERNAMFFRLEEIAEVADTGTGEILFRAG